MKMLFLKTRRDKMGFNTSVLILNDHLHNIELDPEFGKNLAHAISSCTGVEPISVPSGSSGNAAKVIGTHHADISSLVAIGGNMGIEILRTGFKDELGLLKDLADKLGYKVIKKNKKLAKQ